MADAIANMEIKISPLYTSAAVTEKFAGTAATINIAIIPSNLLLDKYCTKK